MLVKTKYFGEIDLAEDKIIEFERGLVGFEDWKKYTILYDCESKEREEISWLQSLDEPGFALPIISPYSVIHDYNPVVEDELIKNLGELNEENLVIWVTLTVPSDITKMSCNLKAPIVINADTKKGCQVIAENTDYVVKYNVYDAVQKMKEKKEQKGE